MIFYPPIIQSAIAGIANSQFCQKMLDFDVSMVTLGGFSIDKKNKCATQRLADRGRDEFLLPEEDLEIKKWCKDNIKLNRRRTEQKIAANVRIVEIDDMSRSWLKNLNHYIDYIEINAHCRQEEIINIEGGQALLLDLARLEKLLLEISFNFPSIKYGIKIRGHIVDDVISLIETLERTKCNYIHIDAMIPEEDEANIELIEEFVQATDIPIFGNNSIRTIQDIQQMLSKGAKAISIARPLINNPLFMKNIIIEYVRGHK
ncbi:MAG: tRNA-dihydrouridine synthase [Candidatus Heimdallarchaeaceae archaeon]